MRAAPASPYVARLHGAALYLRACRKKPCGQKGAPEPVREVTSYRGKRGRRVCGAGQRREIGR